MRKAILASMFLAVAVMAFGQHGTSQIGGKTASKSKAKPKPKATPNLKGFDKPWDSPCGVHYEGGLDEIGKDFEIEWRLVANNEEQEVYWNTHKTVCDRNTGILEAWVKKIIKHPEKDSDNVSSRMIKYEFKCPTSKLRRTYLTAYAGNGNVVAAGALEEEWEEPTPESMGEGMMKAICHKSF
jgi:hypothetical protein